MKKSDQPIPTKTIPDTQTIHVFTCTCGCLRIRNFRKQLKVLKFKQQIIDYMILRSSWGFDYEVLIKTPTQIDVQQLKNMIDMN